MKKIMSISLLAIFAPVLSFCQEITCPAIPFPMKLENKAISCQIIENNHLRLIAPANTDLYIPADGSSKTNNSPRLLFKPDSLFILTSKIKLDFNSKWDAGVLLIYNDSKHYAKLCFENDFSGQPRIVSVVCNNVADDCNSMAVDKNEVYLRIIGSSKGNTFGLFYSENGEKWTGIRGFRLNKTDNLRIGFSAQSPTGKQCSVDFLDISFQNRKPENPWQGD